MIRKDVKLLKEISGRSRIRVRKFLKHNLIPVGVGMHCGRSDSNFGRNCLCGLNQRVRFSFRDATRRAQNIPNRQNPVPNARRISRRVGTSRRDLIKPNGPNRTNPPVEPHLPDGIQPRRKRLFRPISMITLSTNPVAQKLRKAFNA